MLDIPEFVCVSVLKCFLHECSFSSKENGTSPLLTEVEECVCVVISRAQNGTFLQRAVGNLSNAEVNVLLSMLRKFYVMKRDVVPGADTIPSIGLVLEWLCVLLDVHFQDLVINLSVKEKGQLVQWNSMIKDHISVCSLFADLESELGHLFSADFELPHQQTQYSVNLVHF